MNENIIIIDADYADRVAFDLTVNFERMLERQIPKADTARWMEYLALDSGMRQGDHHSTVVLIHDKENSEMKCFAPGRFADELEGQAFSGNLGEFCFNTTSGEGFAEKSEVLVDTLQLALQQKEVKRILIVAAEDYYQQVRQALNKADDDKRITVFTMQPSPGGRFQQELLGYSLMAALGISGEEVERKLRN